MFVLSKLFIVFFLDGGCWEFVVVVYKFYKLYGVYWSWTSGDKLSFLAIEHAYNVWS